MNFDWFFIIVFIIFGGNIASSGIELSTVSSQQMERLLFGTVCSSGLLPFSFKEVLDRLCFVLYDTPHKYSDKESRYRIVKDRSSCQCSVAKFTLSVMITVH